MLFFGLAIFAVCAWAFPWWGSAGVAFALGVFTQFSFRRAIELTFSAGAAWAALAFVFDGRSHGLVSQRMAGLFKLPHPGWMFFAMAVFGAVTVGLGYLAGTPFQSIWRRRRNDSASSTKTAG